MNLLDFEVERSKAKLTMRPNQFIFEDHLVKIISYNYCWNTVLIFVQKAFRWRNVIC